MTSQPGDPEQNAPPPPVPPTVPPEPSATAPDGEPSKWGPPIVAIGAFFVIVAAIGIGVYLIYTGKVGRRETIARPPTAIRVSGENDEPLAGVWLLIKSTTDRRILGRYQKLVGRTAILRTDPKGEIAVPASINKHDNLDLFAWQPGYRPTACRRFVKKGARPTDMFVVRGSTAPSRALEKGETLRIRLGPANGDERAAAMKRLRKQIAQHDDSLHHGESLTLEELLSAVKANE